MRLNVFFSVLKVFRLLLDGCLKFALHLNIVLEAIIIADVDSLDLHTFEVLFNLGLQLLLVSAWSYVMHEHCEV